MSIPSISKTYEPGAAEAKWYPEWENRGYFNGDAQPSQDSYTVVIPPPNVTGVLTLGHVLNNTLQDILIRYQKMRGRNVCWVPGTDHAGIATQAKVEAVLKKEEGVTRHDLGREKFLRRVWEWKEKYGGTIIRQLRSLGTACDWRRERFTLDDGLSDAVQEVFVRLYEKGLIYKGQRMINWCPVSHTALSDEEVIPTEKSSHLWHIRYPLSDGSGELIVATTRPETMLGDTGVAVHPEDERYAGLIGKTITLPLVGKEIPIFADDYVDKEFGTGAVKVTPAHDPNDYAMALRHDLEVIGIMNEDASMNGEVPERFQGLSREDARKAVVAELEETGALAKVDPYTHTVGYSERGHVPVEPRLSEQWFVKMDSLAKPALEAVTSGQIRFHPQRWVNTYRHWMENIRDWCISRQLWWGHRIPAYYCQSESCGEITVARETPDACPKCGAGLVQDEDVLDTWFSSWLWPISVFDWPKETKDLAHFYPTSSLVTGPDIIFFWVARMIMAGVEFMGEVPFRDVYFTSIIRDMKGEKLSKSKGNSPDPLDVIAEYGADALRYSVIFIAPAGQDLRYENKKCEIGRNFANKLWNACRFRQMQGPLSANPCSLDDISAGALRPDDLWMLTQLSSAIGKATQALDDFDFHGYAIDLYEFVWNSFCDWYVESAKAVFYSEDEAARTAVLNAFDYALWSILRIMHPIMPFITEEVAHGMGFIPEEDSIMLADWPVLPCADGLSRLGLAADTASLVEAKFELVRAGRNLRGMYKIPFARKVPYIVKPTSAEFADLLAADSDSMRSLLNAETVTVDPDFEPAGTVPSAVGDGAIIYLPLEGIIDVDEEKNRLAKQHEELTRVIGGIDKKLSNEQFVTRAKPEIVDRERARRDEFMAKLKQVQELAATLDV
ncbi:MAG: valyl-tRNA synthetase [Rhodothermales bacterium]|jgi:valyl-tRNA synthetase